MQKQFLKLKHEILNRLEEIKDNESLMDLEIKYLGRKGEFTKLLRNISALAGDEKRIIGKLANSVKKELNLKIQEAKNRFSKGKNQDEFIDITLPGKKIKRGHLHPITQLQNELEDLFISMGFMVLDGPELESDYYNFEALNIPKHHPARDMQDTFYAKIPNSKFQILNKSQNPKSKIQNLENRLVMRTHTSPVQIRAMQKYRAPLRCVSAGRVFRCEATDACHDTTFDQMEGLMIGENISISNLISVMKELLNKIFKKEVETRVRPGYFPFVEPGIELDIKCLICEGKGCPSCKNGGWLELLPAGMVHPNVLKAGGIDFKKYSGFAFGLGLTRLAMMKYGISDIRLFNSGDLRFLKQF